MNDLFKFLKDLIRDETDVIAAFLMGVIVTAFFLWYLIYWLFGKFHKKKIAELEDDLKKTKEADAAARAQLKEAQEAEQDLKKKARERKTKVNEQDAEIGKLTARSKKRIALQRNCRSNSAKRTRNMPSGSKNTTMLFTNTTASSKPRRP